MCIVGRVFQQPLQCFFLGSCFCNSEIGATGPQNIRLIPACLVVCSLFGCFIQNDLPLLAIITRIVAEDDVSGTVVSLFFIGFGDKINIGFELLLVAFTVCSNELSKRYSVDLIHNNSLRFLSILYQIYNTFL